MDEELLNELEEFNKNSQHKIELVVTKNERHKEIRIKEPCSCIRVIPEPIKYDFNFIDSNNMKYSIQENYFIKEAFELSKMICEIENEKVKIDSLIRTNCYRIIKRHDFDNCSNIIALNYLKQYNPEVIAEIKEAKHHIKALRQSINTLIKDTSIYITKALITACTPKYLYDLEI